jgi:hypothetical protein
MKKKQTKKVVRRKAIKSVNFIFDEWRLEVNIGDSKEISFMGSPITFTEKNGTVYVDMFNWLLSIYERRAKNNL